MILRSIRNPSEIGDISAHDLSYFSPFLEHFARVGLLTGGEVVLATDLAGVVSGALIYDDMEKEGSIFTRSKEVFDELCRERRNIGCFSEIEADLKRETYLIYAADPSRDIPAHRFRHEVQIAGEEYLREAAGLMREVYSRVNERWIRAAIDEGEKCFIVLDGDKLAGAAWLARANGRGRLHSLAVPYHRRREGIGKDLLFARLLWLKSLGMTLAFSEIAESNSFSRQIAADAGMAVVHRMYRYFLGAGH